MIKSIKLKNLLSFGDPGLDLELKPLNVLIGPNGSGKSNLIDAISLLQAAPREIAEPIRKGGGVDEWVFKGSVGIVSVETTVEIRDLLFREGRTLVHGFDIFPVSLPRVARESVWALIEGNFFKVFSAGHGEPAQLINLLQGTARQIDRYTIDESVLSQLRGSEAIEVDLLASEYEEIRIYRDWTFGRHAAARQPQRADARNDFLAEDASNLGLILNGFRLNSAVKKKINSELRHLLEGINDFDVSVKAGTVQLFLEEYGRTIPSTRLSDGTLRYLALLAILCDPKPPRVVCIEEPELGLHPDLLPHVARLMVEASERCQIIATTHSDAIVDALTEHADAVVVCERGESGSTMRRLDAEKLKPWLEDYRLGQLWSTGELGGNRW